MKMNKQEKINVPITVSISSFSIFYRALILLFTYTHVYTCQYHLPGNQHTEFVVWLILESISLAVACDRLMNSRNGATIVSIPKSYKKQLIFLLSCFGKTAKIMLFASLSWTTGPMYHHMYAYKQQTGTKDCLTEMQVTLSDRNAVVTFLDLEKSFKMTNSQVISCCLVLCNKKKM